LTGFILILTVIVFTSTSFIQIILTFEALGLYLILSLILSGNNFSEGTILLLFTLSILEGVLRIYGIVILLNYAGIDFLLGSNLVV